MTEQLSTSAEMERDGEHCQFLTFTVGHEEYGVDIMTVREIKGWSDVTRLPNSPHYLRGVMNLRGLIIPIFDLRARFSHTLTDADIKHVVIILAVGERNIGVPVDSVSDIITLNNNDIKPPPEMEMHAGAAHVKALFSMDDRMVVVLEMAKLFDASVVRPEASNIKDLSG